MPHALQKAGRQAGFTIIELLVVMAILALLMSIAAPRYFDSVERAKEVTLRTNLRLLRESIDKYRADNGAFPPSLQTLVDARYLRSVPVDPVVDTAADWVVSTHPDGTTPGVYDVHSSASGEARDRSAYATW